METERPGDTKTSWIRSNPIKSSLVAILLLPFVFILFSPNDRLSTPENSQEVVQDNAEAPSESLVEQTAIIDSEEFDYLSVSEVNLFRSYDDRTVVTKLERGTEVVLLATDAENDYCNVRLGDYEGWLACGWVLHE